MTTDCQQLLRSLEQATFKLAELHPPEAAEVQQALEERERAIEAIAGWVAAEQKASRPVSPEVAHHLANDLEMGAGILVRLAIDRESTRVDMAKLGRELQILRGLNNSKTPKPNTIDYQG